MEKNKKNRGYSEEVQKRVDKIEKRKDFCYWYGGYPVFRTRDSKCYGSYLSFDPLFKKFIGDEPKEFYMG